MELSRSLCSLALGALLGSAPGAFAAEDAAPEDTGQALRALTRSLKWLGRHPPDAQTGLGNIGLDAWSWYVFSVWHPDPDVRARAGTELDRKLRALEVPPEWTAVALSYWVTLKRIAQLRGIEEQSHDSIPVSSELETLLSASAPTAVWYIHELLRHSGLPSKSDPSLTFIGAVREDPSEYVPAVRDAYRVFHELVSATSLGGKPFELTREQDTFIRGQLPRLIEVSEIQGDTDAVAEVLVTAALLGQRDEVYHDGIAWLFSQQRQDGTYRTARDASPRLTVNGFRHGVLVSSFAMLSSLDRFEPMVKVAK